MLAPAWHVRGSQAREALGTNTVLPVTQVTAGVHGACQAKYLEYAKEGITPRPRPSGTIHSVLRNALAMTLMSARTAWFPPDVVLNMPDFVIILASSRVASITAMLYLGQHCFPECLVTKRTHHAAHSSFFCFCLLHAIGHAAL